MRRPECPALGDWDPPEPPVKETGIWELSIKPLKDIHYNVLNLRIGWRTGCDKGQREKGENGLNCGLDGSGKGPGLKNAGTTM
jgi:hypothetical protein